MTVNATTQKGKLATFLVLSYGLSWLIWLPLLLNTIAAAHLPTLPLQHYLAPVGPALAAFITVWIFEGRKGLFAYCRRVFKLPRNGRVIAIAFAVPVVGFVLGLIATLVSRQPAFTLTNVWLESPIPRNLPLVWLFWIGTYGQGEELGWRGFLLHETAWRFKPWTAVVVTTVGWLFWHAPLFTYDPDFVQKVGLGMVGWILGLSAGSILLGWLTMENGWSVIPAVLWHATFNLVNGAHGLVAMLSSMTVMVAAVYLARRLRRWFRDPRLDLGEVRT